LIPFILEKKVMIKRKIRALDDFDFKNDLGFIPLIKGEIATIAFKNQQELDAHLLLGLMELAEEDALEGREIKVLHKKSSSIPAENELLSTLELTGNLDKLTESSEEKREEKPVKKNPWTSGYHKVEVKENGNQCKSQQSERTVRVLKSETVLSEDRKECWGSRGSYRQTS